MLSSQMFREQSREIPIGGECDVLVLGGGPSGVSASLAAARSGAHTILLERYGFLGGMASAGMVGSLCGFFTSGTQKKPVVAGIASELVKRLRTRGGVTKKRTTEYNSQLAHYRYNPEVLKYVADEMVVQAGVEVLFHTLVVDVIHQKGGYLSGVVAENKSGRFAFLGKMIVDATGDGDIAAKAGAPYEFGDGKNTAQSMTTMFRITHVDFDKAKRINHKMLQIKLQDARDKGLCLPRIHGAILSTVPFGMVSANITSIAGLSGIDARQLTQAELEGRRQVFEYLRFLREYQSGFENSELASIATQVGVRETRRILGQHVLDETEVINGKKSQYGIARGAWPVELHDPQTKQIRWELLITDDDYYEIPIGCLIPNGFSNLLVAGRCISTTHVAQASTRVIAQAIATGEAAGVIASQCVSSGRDPREIDASETRAKLLANGALL
jgi:hypothetical protein